MSTQFLQKFSSTTKIPADRANAVGVGVVDGVLSLNSTAGLLAGASANVKINTTTDSKPILLNSRDYTATTGGGIAIQVKPSQTATTTGALYGVQFSPRLQDAVGSAGLIGCQSAPVLKGNTGDISSDVRAFEASIDLNNAATGRTISGTVSALYAYLQSSNSTTYTGGCAVIHVTLEDTHKWDYLAKVDAANGFVAVATGTTATTTKLYKLKCLVGSDVVYLLGATDWTS